MWVNHRSPSKVENDLPPSGRLYSKIGYRFLQADYSLSMYGNLLAGIDLDKGFFQQLVSNYCILLEAMLSA